MAEQAVIDLPCRIRGGPANLPVEPASAKLRAWTTSVFTSRSGAGTSATRFRGTGCGSTASSCARGRSCRWPVHGNVLEALREGRLEVGEHTLFEPNVWITAPGDARIRIGSGSFLNIGVMVAAHELVEIGDHCMFANGCFVTDASHRFDDPEKPVTWQGFTRRARRGSATTSGAAPTWWSPPG